MIKIKQIDNLDNILVGKLTIPYPVYTTTERDNLTGVLENFRIKNSTTDTYEMYNGAEWVTVDGGITGDILYFDATVGIDGDYATINAAVTAEKYVLKLVSNVTEVADTTTSKLTIDLNGNTLNLDNYSLSALLHITSAKMFGTITFAYSVEKYAFGIGNNSIIENITINNNSTISGAYISDAGIYRNVIVNLPNYPNTGFGSTGALSFFGRLYDITINGGGANCYDVIHDAGNYNMTTIVENLTLGGTFATGQNILYNLGCAFKNIIYNSTTTGKFLITNADYIYDPNGRVTVDLYGTTSANKGLANSIIGALLLRSYSRVYNTTILGAFSMTTTVINVFIRDCTFNSTFSLSNSVNSYWIFDNCTITGAASLSTNYCKYINNTFNNTLTLNGDYNKLTGCTLIGLLTLSSGAEYNVITGNTLSGGLTNSSGNTTNEISNNI